jgi:hypothetical protein
VNEPWRSYEQERIAEEAGTGGILAEVQEGPSRELAMEMATQIGQYQEDVQLARVVTSHGHMSNTWDVNTRPLRILVLFSGTGSVETAVTSHYHNTVAVTVDNCPKFSPTHQCTVQEWICTTGGMTAYEPGYFDIIWASPSCTEYSRAKTTGPAIPGADPRYPHRDLETADDNVEAALHVIAYLQPKYWFVENPEGLLATRPFMRPYAHFLNLCTYCKYGTPYRKATHIWTNATLRRPLQVCDSLTPCDLKRIYGVHPVTAQSGPSRSAIGSGGAIAVYPVPSSLVQELLQQPLSEVENVWLGEQVAVSLISHISESWGQGNPLHHSEYVK